MIDRLTTWVQEVLQPWQHVNKQYCQQANDILCRLWNKSTLNIAEPNY